MLRNIFFDCFTWCGIIADESVIHGGVFEPCRQSERKELHNKNPDKLKAEGHVYYAFDTPEKIEAIRKKVKLKVAATYNI